MKMKITYFEDFEYWRSMQKVAPYTRQEILERWGATSLMWQQTILDPKNMKIENEDVGMWSCEHVELDYLDYLGTENMKIENEGARHVIKMWRRIRSPWIFDVLSSLWSNVSKVTGKSIWSGWNFGRRRALIIGLGWVERSSWCGEREIMEDPKWEIFERLQRSRQNACLGSYHYQSGDECKIQMRMTLIFSIQIAKTNSQHQCWE